MKHLQEYINNSTVNSRLELEAKIAKLEQQLAECRDSLTNNEQRHQKQLTVVGALATAIKQTLTAIKLAAETGEPGLTESFWQEMQDIQDGNYDEKELLSLPASEDENNNDNNPDSPGPHTHDSLVKINLSEIKKIASDLDIAVKDVKQYGSIRQKMSWITAILEKQKEAQDKVETNGKVETVKPPVEVNNVEVVKPLVTSPPVETNDVVDVDSTAVDSSTIEDDNDFEGW